MDDKEYIRAQEACKLLNVSVTTLINWDRGGKIQSIRTKGGHRRYLRSSLPLPITSIEPRRREKICYCRVSTHSQKEDLDRQVEFFRGEYPDHRIIRDIGSGINFKRKGFKTILDAGIDGAIEEVVVTHKDRLCRFGFDLINGIIERCSQGKIVVLDQREVSREEELVNDILSLITVFSSRLYGFRSHQLKKKIEEKDRGENRRNRRGKGDFKDHEI